MACTRGLVLLLLLPGCEPNLVGAPLDAGASDGGDLPDAGETGYPPGPYGTREGDVLEPMTFAGYVNERASDGPVGAKEYQDFVTLADLRKTAGYRYALLNVGAEWCVPCQGEAQVLPQHYAEWAPGGGYLLSVLTEDSDVNIADKRTLDAWIRTFSPNYTMLHDPRSDIARVLAPTTMPLNVIVDLATMRILRSRTGDDPELFQYYDNLLEQN